MKKRNLLVSLMISSFIAAGTLSCSKSSEDLAVRESSISARGDVTNGNGNGNGNGGDGYVNQVHIGILNSAFTPNDTWASQSSQVTWTNKDNIVHTVTALDESFDSGDIAPGSSYSKVFGVSGVTVNYKCKYHHEEGRVKLVYR